MGSETHHAAITRRGVQRVDRPHVPERVLVRDDLRLPALEDAPREVLDLEPVLVVAADRDRASLAISVGHLDRDVVATQHEGLRDGDRALGAEQLHMVAVRLGQAANELRRLAGAEVEDTEEVLVDTLGAGL